MSWQKNSSFNSKIPPFPFVFVDSLKWEGPTSLFYCGPILEALILNMLSKQKLEQRYLPSKC